eukprot:9643-Heterococcus_DN1.PRE.2
MHCILTGEPPGSSLRVRLAAFLPQMAKANEDLDELVQQGKVESIDAHLVPDFGTEAGNADDDDDAAASDSSDSEAAAAAAAEPAAEGKVGSNEKRVVQLSFAIGDFDDTPMAKLEDQQEAAGDSSEQMVTLTELSDVVDGANAADSSSGASEPQKAAAPPKGKLIQEL